MDPYGQSPSPYVGMGNNPVVGVDPDGGQTSPIYDIETGKYLGNDTEGFKGDILFMNGEKYNQMTQGGKYIIKHSWAINNLQGINGGDVSLMAKANAYTDIVSRMPEVDMNKLYNGKISAYNYDFNNRKEEYFNNGTKVSGEAVTTHENGKIKVTAIFLQGINEDLTTVENVQNLLGMHEYYYHGVQGYSNSQHGLFLKKLKLHPSWNGTTPNYQNDVNNDIRRYGN